MCRQGYCSCHYHRDYQSIPRLDTYDREHLDEGAYDTIDPEARVAAEKAMRKRDRQVGGHTTFYVGMELIHLLYVVQTRI